MNFLSYKLNKTLIFYICDSFSRTSWLINHHQRFMQIKLFYSLAGVTVISDTFLLVSCPRLFLYRVFFISTEIMEPVLTLMSFTMTLSLGRQSTNLTFMVTDTTHTNVCHNIFKKGGFCFCFLTNVFNKNVL